MLKIQSLSASYGSRQILHDVSLHVQGGEALTLIGLNGMPLSGSDAICQGLFCNPPVETVTIRYLVTFPME